MGIETISGCSTVNSPTPLGTGVLSPGADVPPAPMCGDVGVAVGGPADPPTPADGDVNYDNGVPVSGGSASGTSPLTIYLTADLSNLPAGAVIVAARAGYQFSAGINTGVIVDSYGTADSGFPEAQWSPVGVAALNAGVVTFTAVGSWSSPPDPASATFQATHLEVWYLSPTIT